MVYYRHEPVTPQYCDCILTTKPTKQLIHKFLPIPSNKGFTALLVHNFKVKISLSPNLYALTLTRVRLCVVANQATIISSPMTAQYT